MRFRFRRLTLSTLHSSLPTHSRKLSLESLETRINPGVIAFSQDTFNVANTAGTVTIELVRTGDTRTTDTVNIVSTNGTAVAPTDYAAVNGTITFVPSATQVPLQIIIHQDPQPGDRAFTLNLTSPSANASLGTLTHATVVIVDNTTQDAHFVSALYQDLLDRAADFNGFAYYSNLLDSAAATRQTMALTFLDSTEYRTLQINQMYQSILGRPSDPGGLAFALNELNQGATFEQIQAQLYASDEYFAKIGTGAPDNNQTNNWIDALFGAVLNRHAESSASSALSAIASTGAAGRTSVAMIVLTSAEADQDRVEGFYETILHRAGDSGGVASWVQEMQQGMRDENVEAAFYGSAEFFAGV